MSLPPTRVVLLVAMTVALATAARAEERPPNVLLVMTDDQGWGDLRSHGNRRIETPALDAFGGRSARFDRFFVSPVCAPTRAALLTGRHHLRTGTHHVTRGKEAMRASEVTVAEILKGAGYATGCFGKWHNGAHYPRHPNGQGFETFFGFCAGHWNQYFDPPLQHNGERLRADGYITDVLTNRAIEFMKAHREEPFFCYVPYNAPHTPAQVPDRYFEKYKERGLGDRTAAIYGMVDNLDDNFGRLLETVETLGLREKTIVIFTTDNGANGDRYDGHMRGAKGSLDEGGTRVPLFIRWPGHTFPGQTVEPIASVNDLLPTIVDMTGVEMPETKPLDGRSLVPLLDRTATEWPNRRIFQHWQGGKVTPNRGAVRTPRWRATYLGGRWRLYDMRGDPSQKRNVADAHPDVVKRLRTAYMEWFNDVTSAGFERLPIEVGHDVLPFVGFPGHEATLQPGFGEGIRYVGKHGWANDWITGWVNPEAYPSWPAKVVRKGRYRVTVLYTCEKPNVGAELRVELNGATASGKVTEAHTPGPNPAPNRTPRPEWGYFKDWGKLDLGVIEPPTGEGTLTLRAAKIAGEKMPDIKAVRLHPVD